MNRTRIAIGLFLIAVLAVLGGRFGLPWLVERQVASALDDHIAGLPDPEGARYSGLALDYWNDQLRLDELRLPVDLPAPGGTAHPALVTVSGIFVDGYDWPRLEAALQSGAATASGGPLVRAVSWDGVRIEGRADGASLGSAGEGRLEGLNAVTFDAADGALTSAAFDSLSLQDLVTTPSPAWTGMEESIVIRAELPSVLVTGWHGDSADSIVLTGLAATAVETASDGSAGQGEVALDGFSVTDWQRGEPGRIGKVTLSGLTMALDLPDKLAKDSDPDVARAMKEPLSITLDSYELADLRYDRQALVIWRSVFEVLAAREPGTEADPATIAGLLESYLVMMERARDLETGIGQATMVGLQANFGEAMLMRMDRFDIRDAFGLKGGSFEVAGLSQKVEGDVSVSIDRYHGETGDFSALPGWLRQVFGQPLAPDSLEKARAWAEGKTLVELVPEVDLGTFTMEGMDVLGPDGRPVRIDLFAIERMRISGEGLVEVAVRMDGISAPLEAGAGTPPQAAMLLQMLKANGIDEVLLGSSIALKAGLGDSTGSLAVGMSGAELADTLLEVGMTGLDYERLRTLPPEHRNAWVMTSRLANARITVLDRGLRTLMLESQAAARPGATAEMLGAQFGAMAEQMGASIGTDASRALGQQLAAFVTGGGKLEISTDLAEPLPMMELIGLRQQPPAAIIDLFGVTARHSAP